MSIRWTEAETLTLMSVHGLHYSIIQKSFPNRTWRAVSTKMKKLGCSIPKRWGHKKSDVSFLLNKSNESFYWLGFLLADGHFNIKSNTISVTLSSVDRNHLEKLAVQLKANIVDKTIGKYNNCTISCSDENKFKDIVKLLNIVNSNKTCNPPVIFSCSFSKNQIVSLIIGFFDGDGHMNTKTNTPWKYVSGVIKTHPSWIDNLSFFKKIVIDNLNCVDNSSYPKITNTGHAILIFNQSTMKKLKQASKDLNLPIMDRKWNKL